MLDPQPARALSLAALLLSAVAPAQEPAQPPAPGDERGAPAQDGAAQEEREEPAAEPVDLGEVIVTATRTPHTSFDLPRSVNVADLESLRRKNRLVALDALDEEIGVWVEKRNGMSSDPVIRGLSGANVLALVNGNSLTTLWGEGGYAGDDLYGKVEAESLERIEVVRGPSSVLYGSSALGGVINFITRKPPLDYVDRGFATGGRLKAGYASAADALFGRWDAWGAGTKARYRVGMTARDIDDVRGGGDLGLLSPSGGEDLNWDLDAEFLLGPDQYLELESQLVDRDHLPRYYRPNQTNFNDRRALALTWRNEDPGFADAFRWSVYGQDKKDVREWLDQDQRGVARWRTYSTDFQATRALGAGDHLLTWGLHFGADDAESADDEQFTITTPDLGTQKAAPDSLWQNAGAYLQDEWELGQSWSLVASARADHFRFEADDNEFWTIPGSSAPENVPLSEPGTFDQSSLTGGLGLVRRLDDDWTVFGSWSRGYRLFPPGFGLRQTGFGILAPTDGFLEPTTADQLEVGTRVRREGWSAGVAAYYTRFRNFQQPRPGEWNGMTGFDLDGDDSDGDGDPIDADEGIFVVSADADAYVTGIEAEATLELGQFHERLEGWSWTNGVMHNYGSVEFADATEPLRHTHPTRLLSKLRWQEEDQARGRWFELVADLVDRFDRVSPGRLNGDVGYLADPQDPGSGLIRPYGLPGYTVFDVRGGLELADGVSLTVGLENLLDKAYRSAHSRMDAAGRSLILGLEMHF